MRILIDADGCPVTRICVKVAAEFKVKCVIFCDTAHEFNHISTETVTVSQGADSADFALANRAEPGDIVVTQDFGLAAICLARRACPISQDGKLYTNENIGGMLEARSMASKIRRSGGRLKGPSKRTKEQDTAFEIALRKLLEDNIRIL